MNHEETRSPPNVPLELAIPDAAQSVCRPLCLLFGLAAQWHVRRAEDFVTAIGTPQPSYGKEHECGSPVLCDTICRPGDRKRGDRRDSGLPLG